MILPLDHDQDGGPKSVSSKNAACERRLVGVIGMCQRLQRSTRIGVFRNGVGHSAHRKIVRTNPVVMFSQKKMFYGTSPRVRWGRPSDALSSSVLAHQCMLSTTPEQITCICMASWMIILSGACYLVGQNSIPCHAHPCRVDETHTCPTLSL